MTADWADVCVGAASFLVTSIFSFLLWKSQERLVTFERNLVSIEESRNKHEQRRNRIRQKELSVTIKASLENILSDIEKQGPLNSSTFVDSSELQELNDEELVISLCELYQRLRLLAEIGDMKPSDTDFMMNKTLWLMKLDQEVPQIRELLDKVDKLLQT